MSESVSPNAPIRFETPPADRPDDPLTKRLGRYSAWVVFGVALAVRLLYFVLIEQPPVQFDAFRYVGAGLAFPLAMTNPGLLTDSVARSEIEFPLLFEDLIQDEQAVCLAADPPTFSKSLNDIFFAGPVYPGFLGLTFRLAPRYDFWVVRIFQAIIDSLTAVLVWLLARRLISPAGAWWAAGIWAVYGATILKCGELNTEVLATAIGVLLVWQLVRAYDDPRPRQLLAAGALCAILALTKASTSALLPVILFGWLLARRGNFRNAIPQMLIITAAFCAVMAPWLLVVSFKYHTLALRDPAYGGANLRASNILEAEGYELNSQPRDFWTYPVWREMRNHPIAYAKLYVRKFYRMWGQPSDEYRRGFPFGLLGNLWTHRLIVVLALFGLFLWPVRAGPAAAAPLSYLMYFVVLHLVMHVVSRYNLLAMPIVGVAAVLGAQWMIGSSGVNRRVGLLRTAIILLGLYAGTHLLRPTVWLAMGSFVSWVAATWACWILGSLVIGVGVFLLARDGLRGAGGYGIVRCGAGMVLLLVFLTQVVPREGHADWTVRLDRPGKVARRIVTLPEWVVRDSIENAFVLIDAVADEQRDFMMTLVLDGHTLMLAADSMVNPTYFYTRPSYPVFMASYGHRLCDVPQWVTVPLDSGVVDSMLSDRRLVINLSVRPASPNPGGLTLHGDLPVRDYHHWVAPSFTLGSIERYYEGGDPRIWAEESLDFKTSQSEIVTDGTPQTDDLSDRWGRQIGQYRMVIRIVKPCGDAVNF